MSFHNERCTNFFKALVGNLRVAKRRKLVAYEGELLLQGIHDQVEVTLCQLFHKWKKGKKMSMLS